MAKVVFIMTDSQRYDMVNVNRATGLKTPCLDALAESGVRFTHAYTVQPVCQPARAALFTGMYPHTCGGWANSMALSQDTQNLGQRLRHHNIAAAFIGKWHLDGGDYFGMGQCPDGWDPAYWYDMRNYLEELTPQERLRSRKTETMQNMDVPAEFTYAHRCADRAIAYLAAHAQDDFFLALSFDEPHHPFLCPREFWQEYLDYEFPVSENRNDLFENKPDYQKIWANERLHQDSSEFAVKDPFFFGCNAFVDSEIGRVLQAVRDTCGEDAVIIYTSDHGDSFYSHRLLGKGPAMYDEMTRVPLFVAGKGIPKGEVRDNPVSHIGLAPLIFDLFKLPVPRAFQGESLLPVLRAAHAERAPCFLEFGRYEVDHDGFGGYQPIRAIVDGHYKLSINLMSQDELYDLKQDPGELYNLIGVPEHYETACSLHNLILSKMNETRDPFRGYYWQDRPWRKEHFTPTWAYTGFTRQSENEDAPGQLDYDTGLPMAEAVRRK